MTPPTHRPDMRLRMTAALAALAVMTGGAFAALSGSHHPAGSPSKGSASVTRSIRVHKLPSSDPRCKGNVNISWIFGGNTDGGHPLTSVIKRAHSGTVMVPAQGHYHVQLNPQTGILTWKGLRHATVTATVGPNTWLVAFKSATHGLNRVRIPARAMAKGVYLFLVGQVPENREPGSLLEPEFVGACPRFDGKS